MVFAVGPTSLSCDNVLRRMQGKGGVYTNGFYNISIQEQALEREQEREDFQKEVDKLQVQVKQKEKQENQEHRLQREVGIKILMLEWITLLHIILVHFHVRFAFYQMGF